MREGGGPFGPRPPHAKRTRQLGDSAAVTVLILAPCESGSHGPNVSVIVPPLKPSTVESPLSVPVPVCVSIVAVYTASLCQVTVPVRPHTPVPIPPCSDFVPVTVVVPDTIVNEAENALTRPFLTVTLPCSVYVPGYGPVAVPLESYVFVYDERGLIPVHGVVVLDPDPVRVSPVSGVTTACATPAGMSAIATAVAAAAPNALFMSA